MTGWFCDGRFGEAVGKTSAIGIGGVLGMWEIGMMLGDISMMVGVVTAVMVL